MSAPQEQAKILADAAPDLLAAAEQALTVLAAFYRDAGFDPREQPTAKLLIAAIMKARGGI